MSARDRAERTRGEPRERQRKLSEVAERVRDDARKAPRRTLDEGEVKAGGE
jgi:hypothetical protein